VARDAYITDFSHTKNSFNGNVCSAFGSGNTEICNPGRVGFSEDLGNQIIAHMPDKTNPVELRTIGGHRDQSIGDDVAHFLVHHGYGVGRSVIGELSPEPDYPYTLETNGNQYSLTVAPSAP
jgi:hypothetical protein